MVWLDIQYGIQPLTIRLGGESANADGVKLRPKSVARTKAMALNKERDLGEGTLHCALFTRIDQTRTAPGVSR